MLVALRRAFLGTAKEPFSKWSPPLSMGPVPSAGKSGRAASQQAGAEGLQGGKAAGAQKKGQKKKKDPISRKLLHWLPLY